jgi:predicted ABC-type ATPase
MLASNPTIYIIAGCDGAGKTTFAKEFLPSIGVIRFLNADEKRLRGVVYQDLLADPYFST